MENFEHFGSNLRRLIDSKNYKTYQKAADDFEISLSYLNQLMRGERSPSLDVLKTIATKLGVSGAYLLAAPNTNPSESDKTSRAQLILEIQALLMRLDEDELEVVKMTAAGLPQISQNETSSRDNNS